MKITEIVHQEETSKLDTMATISAILSGRLSSFEHARHDDKLAVQRTKLGSDGDLHMFYVATYFPKDAEAREDVKSKYSDVEAEVIVGPGRQLSYYDHSAHDVVVDGKLVTTHLTSAEQEEFDELSEKFHFEGGHGQLREGGAQAFYDFLKRIRG